MEESKILTWGRGSKNIKLCGPKSFKKGSCPNRKEESSSKRKYCTSCQIFPMVAASMNPIVGTSKMSRSLSNFFSRECHRSERTDEAGKKIASQEISILDFSAQFTLLHCTELVGQVHLLFTIYNPKSRLGYVSHGFEIRYGIIFSMVLQ